MQLKPPSPLTLLFPIHNNTPPLVQYRMERRNVRDLKPPPSSPDRHSKRSMGFSTDKIEKKPGKWNEDVKKKREKK